MIDDDINMYYHYDFRKIHGIKPGLPKIHYEEYI